MTPEDAPNRWRSNLVNDLNAPTCTLREVGWFKGKHPYSLPLPVTAENFAD